MIILPLLPAAALIAFGVWAFLRGSNSAREDSLTSNDYTRFALGDDIRTSLGWPYFFGRGSPATKWEDGPKGVDCSGYAQMVLVRLGKLSSSAGDRGARTLANDSDPVAVGAQKPGDLAYYPGHVMVVASSPDKSGHSMVIGASGGTETTLGNDANARVKLFDSAMYRKDFVTYMRLR